MSNYYLATLFDKNYISRFEVLYGSLIKYLNSFTIFVLALDNFVEEYIKQKNSDNIRIIQLKKIEGEFKELTTLKKQRNKSEYIFTLSPVLPFYILKKIGCSHIVTLDVDLCFYSTPKKLFELFYNYSIFITPHNFSKDLQHLDVHGHFNVSFQGFKNDKEGLECLNLWKKDCFEWCYDRLDEENERCADQKYLDKWPGKFKSLKIIDEPGAGLAPWNVKNYKLSHKKLEYRVNHSPLIYFHFQGIRFVSKNLIYPGLRTYDVQLTKTLKKLYKNYIREVKRNLYFLNDNNIGRMNKVRTVNIMGALKQNKLIFSFAGIFFYIKLNVLLYKLHKIKQFGLKLF